MTDHDVTDENAVFPSEGAFTLSQRPKSAILGVFSVIVKGF